MKYTYIVDKHSGNYGMMDDFENKNVYVTFAVPYKDGTNASEGFSVIVNDVAKMWSDWEGFSKKQCEKDIEKIFDCKYLTEDEQDYVYMKVLDYIDDYYGK